MFNNQQSTGSGSGSGGSIIKSGYNIGGSLSGMGGLRDGFKEALTLQASDANMETVGKFAEIEGKYRGFNAMLRRASKMKLAAGRAISQTYGTYLGHANQAAQQELNWQKTTATNLERMSETMVDLHSTEKSHSGFALYCDQADKLIQY